MTTIPRNRTTDTGSAPPRCKYRRDQRTDSGSGGPATDEQTTMAQTLQRTAARANNAAIREPAPATMVNEVLDWAATRR